ncbi:hypothetical protein ABT340_24960, partial [Streptosporangium sp. NPDC000239]|uniref:hypothetical protein n=1 Tax=Streptosporangium sp. NPDC000239 TaxID=3154248 RepID=UPI00331B560D
MTTGVTARAGAKKAKTADSAVRGATATTAGPVAGDVQGTVLDMASAEKGVQEVRTVPVIGGIVLRMVVMTVPVVVTATTAAAV